MLSISKCSKRFGERLFEIKSAKSKRQDLISIMLYPDMPTTRSLFQMSVFSSFGPFLLVFLKNTSLLLFRLSSSKILMERITADAAT